MGISKSEHAGRVSVAEHRHHLSAAVCSGRQTSEMLGSWQDLVREFAIFPVGIGVTAATALLEDRQLGIPVSDLLLRHCARVMQSKR